MTKIYNLQQIRRALDGFDPIPAIEEGFVLYSQGKVVVPPVGELLFQDPPGDVHIKYGYIIGDEDYVIKIASGFYTSGDELASIQSGLMLVFKQRTGELDTLLLDEGHLTNIRTAAAGAVAAKYLAPQEVHRIGILGAGVQARLQLQYLKFYVDCNEVLVWGLSQKEVDKYKKDMESQGYKVRTTLSSEEVAQSCNLIVTATPSQKSLLSASHIRRGTHITAVGSDTPEKQELDPAILRLADLVVADSISQCLVRGEIHQALKAGMLDKDTLLELGQVILHKELRRSSDEQITVVDLTGVAVQDIQISTAICKRLEDLSL